MEVKRTVVEAGILFAACVNCEEYLASNKHRFTAAGRGNRWAESCGPNCEYAIFYDSFVGQWRSQNGDLWGLIQGLQVLGACGERLAKFPWPSNQGGPWHGYPVSALDPKRQFEHTPPPDVLQAWIDVRYVTKQQAARIRRRKV